MLFGLAVEFGDLPGRMKDLCFSSPELLAIDYRIFMLFILVLQINYNNNCDSFLSGLF